MNDRLAPLSHEAQVELLRKMLLGRRFEERCAEMYAMQKIGGFCHLAIGQEAISVGAMSTLEPGRCDLLLVPRPRARHRQGRRPAAA